MSRSLRTRRQQLLREAEGYLDLATVCSDRWGLKTQLRDRLAERALAQLERPSPDAVADRLRSGQF